jgi:hypothetical protein
LRLSIKKFVAIFKAKAMKTYDPPINTIVVVLGFLGDYMGRIVRQGKNLTEK